MFISIFAAFNSFILLLKRPCSGTEDAAECEMPRDANSVFFTLYDMINTLLFGNGDVKSLNNTDYFALVVCIFMCSMIAMPIVLLNMLIAIMGDSYQLISVRPSTAHATHVFALFCSRVVLIQRVQERSLKETVHMKAGIILVSGGESFSPASIAGFIFSMCFSGDRIVHARTHKENQVVFSQARLHLLSPRVAVLSVSLILWPADFFMFLFPRAKLGATCKAACADCHVNITECRNAVDNEQHTALMDTLRTKVDNDSLDAKLSQLQAQLQSEIDVKLLSLSQSSEVSTRKLCEETHKLRKHMHHTDQLHEAESQKLRQQLLETREHLERLHYSQMAQLNTTVQQLVRKLND
jgi:hypothetical protein